MEIFFLLLLIVLMATALGSGFPVAFALPGSAIVTVGIAAASGYLFSGSVDAYFSGDGPTQWLSAGVTNLRGVYWEVERDTLIAIPLFIFMGIMLQRSKIAEDLLVTMAQLFGPVPGGLGISVVFVGALLAATTGIVGATVVAMGMISLPAMLRSNYSQSLASGTIAASGTLGQIIPPSIVLIILADQLASAADQASSLRKGLYKSATGELQMPSVFDVGGTSAGEMFLGAFIPGLVLVGLYMVYILVVAILRPKMAPAVPYEGKYDLAFLRKVLVTLVPPLALIFLVLGSIITGIATVNQAGAIGAAGALIMAGYRLPPKGTRGLYAPSIVGLVGLIIIAVALMNFEMNVKAMDNSTDALGIALGAIGSVLLMISLIWSGLRALRLHDTLQGVMLETAKTTSLVFIILLGAAMLTASFRAFGGEDLVREFLNSLPGGFWTQFVIVMAVIFVLGFFLDFIEIAVVVVPIVAPILLADPQANVTAVWLGVMIGLNIQTSFLTPPFGFALFYLRGVAPATLKTIQIYKGVVAFIMLQLAALGIVAVFPPLVNYLPNRVSFLSETAPPPRNPKLQLCLEDYVTAQLAQSSATTDAIAAAKLLDLSALPKDLARQVTDGIANADKAVLALADVATAAAVVETAAVDYRPVQVQVRSVEKLIRKLEAEVATRQTTLGRLHSDNQERKDELEVEIAGRLGEIEALRGEIPAGWPELHKTFAALTTAEEKARNLYRRAADGSYEDAVTVLEILQANDAYAALAEPMAGIRTVIETGEGDEALDQVKALEDQIGAVAGAGDIKSALGKARRALDKGQRDEALAQYQKALEAYDEQHAWRADAAGLVPGLTAYFDAMKDTLAIRVQNRLSRAQALAMASCTAHHRDISLNF